MSTLRSNHNSNSDESLLNLEYNRKFILHVQYDITNTCLVYVEIYYSFIMQTLVLSY